MHLNHTETILPPSIRGKMIYWTGPWCQKGWGPQLKELSLLCYLCICLFTHLFVYLSFPGGANGKESICQSRRYKRCRFDPCVGKIPWRRKWQPTPVLLPGKSHGQRSMVGYHPWGRRKSDTTEQLSMWIVFYLLSAWAHRFSSN